jgi:HAD superfamily hydrolase (TIGR01549 family)
MHHVLLDLDGTLVDSVYLHVVCWHDALADAGRPVPARRIHAGIGLGSDRLLRFLLGEVPDPDSAAALADDHRRRFLDRADSLRPTRGAAALLADLSDRAVPHVVATSAGSAERAALLAVLGDPDVAVTDSDSAADSKPDPAPLRAAAGQLDAPLDPTTLMVGDAPWDGYAAHAAGVTFVAVRCGGFPDPALLGAGAQRIADDPADLLGTL